MPPKSAEGLPDQEKDATPKDKTTPVKEMADLKQVSPGRDGDFSFSTGKMQTDRVSEILTEGDKEAISGIKREPVSFPIALPLSDYAGSEPSERLSELSACEMADDRWSMYVENGSKVTDLDIDVLDIADSDIESVELQSARRGVAGVAGNLQSENDSVQCEKVVKSVVQEIFKRISGEELPVVRSTAGDFKGEEDGALTVGREESVKNVSADPKDTVKRLVKGIFEKVTAL